MYACTPIGQGDAQSIMEQFYTAGEWYSRGQCSAASFPLHQMIDGLTVPGVRLPVAPLIFDCEITVDLLCVYSTTVFKFCQVFLENKLKIPIIL